MGTLTSALSKAINDSIDVVEREATNQAFDDVIKLLREWNCQDNHKIRTTINTVIMRVSDLRKE